jgi:hypothetical protein
VTRLLAAIRIWWSSLVFALKQRAGFRLLGTVAGVTGVVSSFERSDDGDLSFDVTPDAEFAWVLEYPSRHVARAAIHCEVVPADQERLAAAIGMLRIGARVRVGGQRAWDGCHQGHGVVVDALCVLLRAAPVLDGWVEVHPVLSLEVLT